MQIYRTVFAGRLANPNCETCGFFKPDWELYTGPERIYDCSWVYCPECGDCAAKFYIPIDDDFQLVRVPVDYKPPTPIVNKKEEKQRAVDELFALLRKDLTE